MFSRVALSLLGGLVILAAVLVLFLSIRSRSSMRNVRKYGKLISATVTKVDAEFLLQSGGHTTAYYAHAVWEDPRTHRVYRFKSDAGGIQLALKHPPGSAIDVLIDPTNPKRYEVVLELNERSYI